MYRKLVLLAGGLVLLGTARLGAEDAIVGQMYGSGVHTFFSRDYQQAYEHLASAVDAGAKDPRVYYFRGLCYLKLGRQEQARMDFEEGARLEAEDVNRFYDVGRSLERIQGRTRLMLEEYRATARIEAMKRAEELRRKRYGELREAEQRVLEAQAAAAPETPIEVPAQPAETPTDPFGIGPTPQSPVGPGDVTPATAIEQAAPPEEAPPKAEPVEMPAAPATEDPFAVPAPEQPAEEAAPAAADAPFGAPPAPAGQPTPPAADDPFATQPAPAGKATPPAADDPFGAAPAPAGKAAPPAAGDPFGAPPAPARKAAPPAAGDPFGAPPAPAGQATPPAAKANPFIEEEAEAAAGTEEEPAPGGGGALDADPFK